MRSVLMIMNAREIPESIAALRSLQVPKVWFRGYQEKELQPVLNRFIQDTDYDNYLIQSDDTVPTQQALDAVLWYLDRLEVVSGWCNLRPGSDQANVWFDWRRGNYSVFQLMRNRVTWRLADLIRFNVFEKITDVQQQRPLFPTYFMGGCFTGMRRELWLKFPYRTWHNPVLGDKWSSDYALCYDLHKAGYPMFCARDAFVYHLKSTAHWIVGKVPKEVILEDPSVRAVVADRVAEYHPPKQLEQD